MSNEVLNFDTPCDVASEDKFTESEETLVSYLSGWVARKAAICRQCQEALQKPAQEHSYACRTEDVFASYKRYTSACSTGLVLPRSELVAQIHQVEELFRLKFDALSASCDVGKTLYNKIHPTLNFDFLFSDLPEHALYLSQKITKLYTVMRIYYAVLDHSTGAVGAGAAGGIIDFFTYCRPVEY